MSKLLIIGAGGLGKMVYEVAQAQNLWQKISFLDDAVCHEHVVGKCVDYTLLKQDFSDAVVAFGDNRLRLHWTKKILSAGYRVPCMIHPSAVISPSAELGAGCLILQNAVINTGAKLGMACLVNAGAIIDHDAHLERAVHVNLRTIIKAWAKVPSVRQTEAGDIVQAKRRQIEGVTDRNLADALFEFKLGETTSYVKPFGSGHINQTYAVYQNINGTDELRYVIQRINTNVFRKPREVMENIFGVTQFLRRRALERGGEPDRETLNYIKTRTGDNYFEDSEGGPWRCYNFIPHSVCIESARNTEDFYHAGKSFGNFLSELQDYPADTLHETIEKFHDTRKRYNDFERALKRDVLGRSTHCQSEVAFLKAHKKDCSVLMDLLEQGKLPLRVTHNDTKLNNILFDEQTGQALCVIDLDTIMPGLSLNDYGDSIRYGACSAAEDEPDLSKVSFLLPLFEAYTKGYLESVGQVLTKTEKEYLAWGAKIMTLECGIRFLTDYLQGDVYFKTSHSEHNLWRARTQFKLVSDMEEHWEEMNTIIQKYIA